MRRRRSRLVRRLLVLEVATVLLTVVIAGGVSAWNTASLVEAQARERVLGLALSVAGSPGTAAAVAARDVGVLEPAAEAVRTGADVSFVTIMTPDGTRLSHPDPALIGQTYRGTFAPAAAGQTLVETFGGTLGVSVRAIVPVRAGPVVVGMVAVGILSVDVSGRVANQLLVLGAGALAAIALGVLVAALAARRVRRDTLGLEPDEITALHRHHDAVLHAMREGLLVVDDATGRVAVLNAEAARLLGVAHGPVGRVGVPDPATADPPDGPTTLAGLGVDPALRERLAGPDPLVDETLLVGERVLLVSRRRLSAPGTPASSVVTLRDRTEVSAMVRELDDARSVAGALRFQAHEHANHLQAVSTLIELGALDDARDLAVRWSRDVAGLGDRLRAAIADPALAALVLDKATDARDRALELRVAEDVALPADHVPDAAASDDLVTVVGNLLDNALDAARDGTGRGVVDLDLSADPDGVVVRVADDGPGLADPEAAFRPGWSTKDAGDATPARRRGLGLALVARVVERRGGRITTSPNRGGGTVVTVALPDPAAGTTRPAVPGAQVEGSTASR